MSDEGSFLARWSRRKALVREGRAVPAEPPVPVPAEPALRQAQGERDVGAQAEAKSAVRAEPGEAPPAPTLEDVEQLTRGSDYTRFVAADVDPQVKNAALKKLFSDPQFNVMDGLDVYIDDYNKPDPLPASMLRQLVQSRALGLFDDDDEKDKAERQAVAPPERADTDGSAAADAATCAPDDISHPSVVTPPHDPDPAVRLQPDDAAGPSGAGAGTRQDAGRER